MSLASNIVATKSYKQQVELIDIDASNEDGYFQRWYKISEGYVVEEDVYSYYHTGSIIEFPTLQYEDKNAYVTLVQTALSNIYPESFAHFTGILDSITESFIKKLQKRVKSSFLLRIMLKMLHFNANRNLFCNFVLWTAVITKFSFPKI